MMSVSDLKQTLRFLRARTVFKQSHFFIVTKVCLLLDVYYTCICKLSTRIYYHDQMPVRVKNMFDHDRPYIENGVSFKA